MSEENSNEEKKENISTESESKETEAKREQPEASQENRQENSGPNRDRGGRGNRDNRDNRDNRGGDFRRRSSAGGNDYRNDRNNRNRNDRGGNDRNSNFRDRDNQRGGGRPSGGRNPNGNQPQIFKSKLGVDEGNASMAKGSVGTWAGNFLEIEADLMEKIRREARDKYMEPSYLANTILREAFAARKRQEGNHKTNDVINSFAPRNLQCPKCKHEFSVSRDKDKFRQNQGRRDNRQFDKKSQSYSPSNKKVGFFKALINKFLTLFNRKK